LRGVVKTAGQLIQRIDHVFERNAFPAERLRSVWVIPDIGLFEFALNFGQAFRLAVIVKDTPSTR
jgi:hypothetical protein